MKDYNHLNSTKPIVLLFILLFALLEAQLSSQAMPLASTNINQPDGVGDVVGGGDDFATTVLRDPWDMNEETDVWEMQNMPDAVFANGTLRFTAGTDSYFWLLHQGYPSAQNIGKTGVTYPIDASKYRVLSFRMWSDLAGFAYVYWFYDQAPSKFAWTTGIPVQPGWHIYTVDLKNIGLGGTAGGATGWNGMVAGLRLNPYKQSGVTSNVIEIDWVRLTPHDTSHTIPISWSGVSGSVMDLYLDDDTSGCDGPQIGSIAAPPASDTFNWGAAVLPNTGAAFPYPLPVAIAPGDYYVCVRVDGGSPSYSSGPLTVDGAPMLWFTHPSYLTGPDYAANAGIPWNMNNANTFTYMYDIDSYQFSSGQFHATNTGGDPVLRFNTPVPLDTGKYKYFTFRMYLEGDFDLGGGWVGRVFWYHDPFQPSTTDDIVIRPGWNTYTLDLTQAILEPGSNPWSADSWSWFRFDPNENIRGVPWTFHIDYALLTGDPTGKTNSFVPIWYELSETSGVTVTLYYDTDTSSGGETQISEYTPSPPSTSSGPYFVYLPLIIASPLDLPQPSGTEVLWDTTGVPAGSYYILAEVTDGCNTTRWYSDVPFVLTD